MPFDESQPEPLTESDTSNHTKFYGSDSSAGYATDRRLDGTESLSEHYSRLAMYNTGIWTRNWADKEAIRNNDNLAVFDSIAASLELTDHQKHIGRLAFEKLNLRDLSSPNGIDAALVAIMVSAMACSPDGRTYHPERSGEKNDELFTSLLADLGYRDKVIQSCFAKVSNLVDF